jgi:hypothetical protein
MCAKLNLKIENTQKIFEFERKRSSYTTIAPTTHIYNTLGVIGISQEVSLCARLLELQECKEGKCDQKGAGDSLSKQFSEI